MLMFFLINPNQTLTNKPWILFLLNKEMGLTLEEVEDKYSISNNNKLINKCLNSNNNPNSNNHHNSKEYTLLPLITLDKSMFLWAIITLNNNNKSSTEMSLHSNPKTNFNPLSKTHKVQDSHSSLTIKVCSLLKLNLY